MQELLNKKKSLTLKDVEAFLFSIGFVFRRQTSNHRFYFNPQLVGCPSYETGTLTIGIHCKGQNKLSPQITNDLVKICNFLENSKK